MWHCPPWSLDATLTVVNGLTSPSCYSFQAANGRFPRHRDRRLRFDHNTGDATFRQDATFRAVDGSAAGSIFLEFHSDGTIRPTVPTL